jgi:ligand-binding sensor domain-containing protein/signal transduction histidine kinase
MSVVRTFIILAVYLLPIIGMSQSYFFNHYDLENGLISLGVNCITQDKYGYLWLGSKDGLMRFNGEMFEEIEYSHDPGNDQVFDIMFDNKGILWIAGKNGVSSYDGLNFKYYSISNIDSPYNCYGLYSDSDGNIFFFHGGKSLYSIENDRIVNVSHLLDPINGSIIKVTGKTSSQLKILTSYGQLWLKTDKDFEIFSHNIPGNEIILATNGDVFLKNSGILSQLKEINGEFIINEIYNGENEHISEVMVENNGHKWIGYEGGLILISAGRSIEFNKSLGFDGGSVLQIFQDKEGSIWIVTRENGLYSYHGDALKYLEFSRNQRFTPTSFFINDKGKLFISYFGKGVDVFDDQKVGKINAGNGLTSNYVRSISVNEDSYWFVGARGVTVLKDNRYNSYTVSKGLPHNYCFHSCIDNQGRTWVGTEGGVAVFENSSIWSLSQDDGLLSNRIKYIRQLDNGDMLLMSDNGIDKYVNGEVISFINQGFKNKEILNTVIPDQAGNMWIGSDINGLIFYDRSSGNIRYINEIVNFPFNRVKSITFYKDNYLCIGTERGIYSIEVTMDGNVQSIASAGIERGFPDFETIQNAILLDSDLIYFGTSIGVVIFNPERLSKNNFIPVNVSSLRIEFKDTDWKNKNANLDTWLGIPINPILNYDQNDLQINFKGVSLQSKDRLWYRHKLENYDQDWSMPMTNESVLYANLNPGKYQFNVSASYDGLNWSESYSSINFIIAPPFWRTWWFYVLIFASLLLGFVVVNNYRIKIRVNQLLLIEKLNKEEFERIQKKVAMDFHDEIGNHLTSISMLVQLIRNKDWEVPGELKDFLEKIDSESKNLFLGTKDFIWSIDPKNNNLKEVFYKIRDYGEEVFDSTNIKFQVKNGISKDVNVSLPPGFTRQIVLIFKEAINNTVKHAGCSIVSFSVSMHPNMFEVKLSDDGIGFKTDEMEYYNGLKKMKFRGEKIRGDLVFNSGPQKGTEIILKADLNKNIAS